MKWQLLIGFFLFIGQLSGQIGLNSYYQFQDEDYWKVRDPNGASSYLVENVFAFSIDYKIKPFEEKRIEFVPEIVYALSAQGNLSGTQTSWGLYSLNLNTNFYPLDFKGDCHCPTFTKQNPFFKKGFFLKISPGISFLHQSVGEGTAVLKETKFIYSLGIGLGLDIGISEKITLTPFVSQRFYSEMTWADLNKSLPNLGVFDENPGAFQQLNVGIRVEFQLLNNY